jgi:alkylation response protein AidB-like acyl-CoA dehydrogenase
MNFDFSADQEHLRSEVRRFLEARCPISNVRKVLEDPDKHYDVDLWSALVEQGWTALALPEAYGGLGMGHTELCVLAEELGRVLAPVPFASTVYVLAEALVMAGSSAQKERLNQIADGSCRGCLAMSEGPGEPSYDRLQTRVEDGRISGTKIPVTDGMAATVALVLAQDRGAARLFLADLSADGVTREPVGSLDPTRDTARITFQDVPCEPLGDSHTVNQLLDRAAVLLTFEQIGGADRCLEQAIEFARMRYAFGRPIGSQQAIKHKLADMYVNNQIARSNAYYGAWALSAGSEELPAAAAAARVAGCTAYWYAAKENIQTHGGIGFTWESDQHLHERRALQLGTVIGSAAAWRERLVDAVSTCPPMEKV